MSFKRGKNPHKALKIGNYSGGVKLIGAMPPPNESINIYFDPTMDKDKIMIGRKENAPKFVIIGEECADLLIPLIQEKIEAYRISRKLVNH